MMKNKGERYSVMDDVNQSKRLYTVLSIVSCRKQHAISPRGKNRVVIGHSSSAAGI